MQQRINHRHKRHLVSLLTLLMWAGLPAVERAQVSEQGGVPAQSAPAERLSVRPPAEVGVELGPGDSISIRVLDEDELSKDYRISEAGQLLLPMLGTVRAAGMTARQLEVDLRERYARFIQNPQLNVTVIELRSRPVTINGAVRNPGMYQLKGGSTLQEVLAMAGGVLSAGTTVSLTRKKASGIIEFPGAKWLQQGEAMMVTFNLQAVVTGAGREAGFVLRPYDSIYVSESSTRLVYVAGEVNHPGAVQLVASDAIPMTEIIAMAGGYKSSGRIDKVLLWSKRGGGKGESTVVDLKDILRGKAEDRMLGEGDYVIVPPKGGLVPVMASVAAMLSPMTAVSVIIGRY
jgi:polysaccharide export outer membrane protein